MRDTVVILPHMWVKTHRELEIYKRAFELAGKVYLLSQRFPKEEVYSLTDQMRRSSRAVCANMAEAWGKRRYKAVFVNKLTDAHAELLETQTWLEFAVKCRYLSSEDVQELDWDYSALGNSIQSVIEHADDWCKQQSKPAGSG